MSLTAKTPISPALKWNALDVAFANKSKLRRVISACERALFPQMHIGELEDNVWVKRAWTLDDMRSLALLKLRECGIKRVQVPDLPELPEIPLRESILVDDMSACPGSC